MFTIYINAIIFKLQLLNFNIKLKFSIDTMNINANIAINFDSYVLHSLVKNRHLDLKNRMSYFV